jgi:hypothetical protein
MEMKKGWKNGVLFALETPLNNNSEIHMRISQLATQLKALKQETINSTRRTNR